MRKCFIAIGFQLCFRLLSLKGSGKPGWLEIQWYTSALVYADDVNILGGVVHIIKKTQELY
jgi:hypothetical protein